MRLAIITARGGSKRIPRKNIREFCGKPIIAYSIQSALQSNCFDEVMVSTDDAEIAEVAQKWGAKIPFMRSIKTATDFATTSEVLIEVLQEYKRRDYHPEWACCLYPTAPFITSTCLSDSFNMLCKNNQMDALIPVTRFSYPIQRALRLIDGKISMFQSEHLSTRSQDLEPAYHDAGQFYWFQVEKFLKTQQILGQHTGAFILPEWQVQDIDNEDDWMLAEMKYRMILEKKKRSEKNEKFSL